MAMKHVAAAATLGVASFGLGWLGTAHLMRAPDLRTPIRAVHAAPEGLVSSLSARVVADVAGMARPSSLEPKVEKTSLRANLNAVAAIAAFTGGPSAGAVPLGENVAAYAPSNASGLADLPSGPDPAAHAAAVPAPPEVSATGLQEAVVFYRNGDLLHGDALARSRTDPIARTALEWLALRGNPRMAGFNRITAFLKAHADWPAAQWLRRKAEEAVYGDKREPGFVLAFFAVDKPISPLGELALARALRQAGRTVEAADLVRAVWRTNDLSSPVVEAMILREFGDLLNVTDHKYRAAKLLYREANNAALRAAERAGPQAVMLAKARILAAKGGSGAGALLDGLASQMRTDPAFQFARIQYLRHSGHWADAAAAMLAVLRDPAALVDGDAWWAERRMLARKLIDEGDPASAYRLCAEHAAVSSESKVEAEFHAGWIALRFLDDADKAAAHFARAAEEAVGPADASRAQYWQGRAAEALGDATAAQRFYSQAGRFSANYYGQLALAKTGVEETRLRQAPRVASGEERSEAIRVAEVLYSLGDNDLALQLVVEGVQHLNDTAQLAALGAVAASYHDARATLIVGKLAASRGFALDDLAFPVFGIPSYQPVANSAERAVVYAIARQESAFQPRVTSSAGAKGLMQMMPATARVTASRAGLQYNESWLTNDPSFNAKLGAAHLGSLLSEQNGSYIMTFAAYNAGGGAVKRWVGAYGDPRHPDVDPVDWVELIPYTETRHYVQTIMENMEVYRLRFGERNAMLIDRDLRQGS